MDEQTERLIEAACTRVSVYATQVGRTTEPTSGTMGEYYWGFRDECQIGQDTHLMQAMRDPAGHAAGLRELIGGSDRHVWGQAQARVAGYLHEYLKIHTSPADAQAYVAAQKASNDERLARLFDKINEEDRRFDKLQRNARTAEEFAELRSYLEARDMQDKAELAAAQQNLAAWDPSMWQLPTERLAGLIEQAPDVFAHLAFPPELRLLASRVLLHGEFPPGSDVQITQPLLTAAERAELLRDERYPLVDPESGGVLAMSADSPDQVEMWLLTGREPGSARQLARDLTWATQQAQRFSETDAVMVEPGGAPVPVEHRARGRLLTVVSAPRPSPRQFGWLAGERGSFKFWTEKPGGDYIVIARRDSGVRCALDNGLFTPDSSDASGGQVVLQPFGHSPQPEPPLPDHVRRLPGPEAELTGLNLAVPDIYSDLEPPPVLAELGAWPPAILRPTSRRPDVADPLRDVVCVTPPAAQQRSRLLRRWWPRGRGAPGQGPPSRGRSQ
ncbi:MAG: hypothetical protein ACRDPW_08355 [Mycobacteriales bacterium]